MKSATVEDASSYLLIVGTLSCLITFFTDSTNSLHNLQLLERLCCSSMSLVIGIGQVGVLSLDLISRYDSKLSSDYTRNCLHYCN